MKTVFMYSGQGSQYYQMGRDLFESDPAFRRLVEAHDVVIRDVCGYSVLHELYGARSKAQPFHDVAYAPLALYLIECCLTRLVQGWGIEPDLLLGYSAGELCASTIAGAISFEDGVRLLDRQATLLATRCERAILLVVLAARSLLEPVELERRALWLIADNHAECFVVAGTERPVAALERELAERRIVTSRLPVDYGFHSPLVAPMEREFREAVRKLRVREPQRPLFSCTFAGSPAGLEPSEHLWRVLRDPIDFPRAARLLEQSAEPYRYLDLGPAGTLANLIKHNRASGGAAGIQFLMSPLCRDRERASIVRAWLTGRSEEHRQFGAVLREEQRS